MFHVRVFPDKSRSSHQRCSVKKGVLRNFAKFIRFQSLSFNNVAGLRPSTLLKERLWHRCFLVNFVKFLRTPLGHCFCKSLNRLVLISFIFTFFFITMHEIDTAAEVPLEPFQTFMIEIFCKNSYSFCLLTRISTPSRKLAWL